MVPVAAESLACNVPSLWIAVPKAATSTVNFSSVSRKLIHVGCANVGRCRCKPKPRMSIRMPSLKVYVMRLRDK